MVYDLCFSRFVPVDRLNVDCYTMRDYLHVRIVPNHDPFV